MSYEKLKAHRDFARHSIVIAEYGDGDQFAVECETCSEVLVSFDATEPPAPGDLVLRPYKVVFTRSLADDEEIIGAAGVAEFQRKARSQFLAEWYEACVVEQERCMLWLDEPVVLLPTGEYELSGTVAVPANEPPAEFIQVIYDNGALSGSFELPSLHRGQPPTEGVQ